MYFIYMYIVASRAIQLILLYKLLLLTLSSTVLLPYIIYTYTVYLHAESKKLYTEQRNTAIIRYVSRRKINPANSVKCIIYGIRILYVYTICMAFATVFDNFCCSPRPVLRVIAVYM